MDTPIIPTLAWTRQFGSREYDHAEDMCVDRFGNVYLAGHSKGQIGQEAKGKDDSWIAKLDAYGNLHWMEQLGSGENDHIMGITTDEYGFLYISGHTSGSIGEGSNQGGMDAWVAKYNPDGKRVWLEQIGTSSEDAGHGIAVSAKGDVYVAGYSHGDLEESGASESDADAWVAKFENNGSKIWLKHIGSRADDVAYDVAVDAFGHVYVGGYTRGRISTNSTDRGSKQIWVMKLDGEGEQIWLREFGSGGRDDEMRSLATDNQGNVFVTGMTYLERSHDNQLKRNVFITKIRANSQIAWSRFIGSEETDIAYGIDTDPMGNIFVTGYTQGEVEEGKDQGKADVFVAKYNTEGEEQWVTQLGTSAEDKGEAIAIDAFGNIFVAGLTQGRMDPGQNFYTGNDAWVSKYHAQLSEQEQFFLMSDYMQQMNGRVSRIEIGSVQSSHEASLDLIRMAESLISGAGDGRISGSEAGILVNAATQAGEISISNKMQLAYIFFSFELTESAQRAILAVFANPT